MSSVLRGNVTASCAFGTAILLSSHAHTAGIEGSRTVEVQSTASTQLTPDTRSARIDHLHLDVHLEPSSRYLAVKAVVTAGGSGRLELSLAPYAREIEAPAADRIEEGSRIVYRLVEEGQEFHLNYRYDLPQEQEGIGFHLGPDEGYILWESRWYPTEYGSEYGQPVPYSLSIDIADTLCAIGAGDIEVEAGHTEIRYAKPSRPFFVYGRYRVIRRSGAEFWCRPGLSDDAAEIADRVGSVAEEVLGLYDRLFGSVSSQPFRFVDITRRGGWGAPMTLLLSERSLLSIIEEEEMPIRMYWYLAHELAHTWWGNHVVPTMDIYGFMVEGAANYAAALAVERRYGVQEALRLWEEWKEGAVSDVTLINLPPDNPHYTQVAYNKGAWLHRMLEGWLGRENYIGVLKGIVTDDPRPTLDSLISRLCDGAGVKAPALHYPGSAVPAADLIERFFEGWGAEIRYPYYELKREETGWSLQNVGSAVTPPVRVVTDGAEQLALIEPGDTHHFEPHISDVQVDPGHFILQHLPSAGDTAWRPPEERETAPFDSVMNSLQEALDSGDGTRVRSMFQQPNQAVEALVANAGKLRIYKWQLVRVREVSDGLEAEFHFHGSLGDITLSGPITIKLDDGKAINIVRIRLSPEQ